MTVLIDDELARFLQIGSTLIVSAASDSGVPELCLGLACLVDADRRRVRAVFDRRSAAPLLALVAGGARRVASVSSRPTDLRTVQIKGDDATVQPLPAHERASVAEVVDLMCDEFARIGFGNPYASTMLDHDPAELVCIGFTVSAVFDQTPGPQAGRALKV